MTELKNLRTWVGALVVGGCVALVGGCGGGGGEADEAPPEPATVEEAKSATIDVMEGMPKDMQSPGVAPVR
ncbi:hypothetical protein AB1L88_02550 [Tautonia sp. JC769]|uniref:hypothetical protein n=1 Tax=Tautonia sp. JC769 TaxID=3232135 RepID=UPI0034589765